MQNVAGAARNLALGSLLALGLAGLSSIVQGCAPASESASVESFESELGAAPRPKYRGINLNGADFGSKLPGQKGVDYTFPTTDEVDYYLSKGMNTFRIGFAWERLQPVAQGPLDAAYFAALDSLVRYATAKNAKVVLNPQNFARYYGAPIGSAKVPNATFADLWRRLAVHYGSNANVLFGLVNEPNNMPTENWVAAANDAISAIRGAGATNVILVPGNGWSGAYSWYDTWYGTPNAVAMLDIVDPSNNMLFEVHQYLDDDSSGGSETCVSRTVGSDRLKKVVAWLEANKKKAFIGEFAGSRNDTCYAAVKDMLEFVTAHGDVLVGWTWWGGGPWWGEYRYTLEPTRVATSSITTSGDAGVDADAAVTDAATAVGDASGLPDAGVPIADGGTPAWTIVDRPQMSILAPFLK